MAEIVKLFLKNRLELFKKKIDSMEIRDKKQFVSIFFESFPEISNSQITINNDDDSFVDKQSSFCVIELKNRNHTFMYITFSTYLTFTNWIYINFSINNRAIPVISCNIDNFVENLEKWINEI